MPESPTTPLAEKTAVSKLVAVVTEVPALPTHIGKILELAENPNGSASDLNDIISQDPSLTAQILKSANSAFYGFPNKISTVPLAIMILGFKMVKTIVLSSSVFKIFKESKGSSSQDAVAIWEHALKCGVACKLLATDYRYYVAGEAFTAGILHDIGRLALSHYAPKQHEEIMKMHAEKGCSLIEAESAVLGFDHAELGGALLDKWKLPLHLIEAVRYHHIPMQASNALDLTCMTHLADYLCHLESDAESMAKEKIVLDGRIWDVIHRTQSEEETLRTIMADFKVKLEQSQSFFDVLRGNAGEETPAAASATGARRGIRA